MSAAVYGIGNILMGDDGIGPAVARFLADRWTFDDDVVIEDLGTPSLDLPGYLIGHDLVVLVDAVASVLVRSVRPHVAFLLPAGRIRRGEPMACCTSWTSNHV